MTEPVSLGALGGHPDLRRELASLRAIALDFDGVLTDNGVYVAQDGQEVVRCSRSDGLGLERLRRETKVRVIVISSEPNPVVARRCEKLGLPAVHGCDDKVAALRAWLEAEVGVLPDGREVAFLGNDANDRACLEFVSMPVVVADAHPCVRDVARLVTVNAGGQGAVRELCDSVCESLRWR